MRAAFCLECSQSKLRHTCFVFQHIVNMIKNHSIFKGNLDRALSHFYENQNNYWVFERLLQTWEANVTDIVHIGW